MRSASLVTLGHFIGGEDVAGRSKRAGDVYDPATGETARRVAFADASDVDAAVGAARVAFAGWSETPPVRRAAILFRFRELVLRDAERLAALITAEHGKTLADARGELQRGLEVVEFACGIPHLLKGDVTENVARDVDSFAVRQPLGACVGITPFNFPAMVPMWMFPVALACGNTFIL
jgi:malonate-semialdehyde dehydrogenase (acetylating) / methylmalonate-semialdehyde dehydrogenase